MPTIDLVGSTIRPQSRKGGKMYAKKGYDIKCHFTVKNTSSKQRSVWYAVHEHYGDRRLLSGTLNLNPGSSRGFTKCVTMPNHQVNLKFWAGTIDAYGDWIWTDKAGFDPIYLDAQAAPQVGYVHVTAKVPLGDYVRGAEILVDGKRTGVSTPGKVSMSPGRHWVRISKSGYVPGTGLYRDVKAGQTVNIELTLIPVSVPKPVTCGISPSVRTPAKLPLKLSAAGIPTPPSSFMIHMTFTALCKEAGKLIATPSGMPDLPITVSLGGMPIKTFSTSGSRSFDALSGIVALLYAGRITQSMSSLKLEVRYPKTIEFESKTASGRVTQYDTFRKDIPLDITSAVPSPKTCMPTISGFAVPDSIPVTLPAIGTMPTVDLASFPVKFRVGGNCPAAQFPLNIILSIGGHEITKAASQGNNNIDIASTVRSVLQMKSFDELKDLRGIAISLKYPSKIEYSSPGTGKDWKTLEAYVHISTSSPANICTIIGSLSYPGEIPLTLPAGGFGIPTLDVAAPMTAMFGTTGCTAPANLMDYLYATVTLDNRSPITIRPDSSGNAMFDLSEFSLPSISEATRTLELKMEFPERMRCSTPTPEGKQVVTRTIQVKPTMPDGGLPLPVTPTCVLTNLDYILCPDGSTIQINECVNGVKVPIIPTPTCPTLPPVTPPVTPPPVTPPVTPPPVTPPVTPPAPTCVLTAADQFTCPDGTVIQLNKCVNGVKVPTGATCPPPPGPGPTCTEGAVKDLFVCPDGTKLYLKKCVNGVWVDTGERCPEEPECTRSEYFTCPDGTRIELYRCVEGKRVATGNTCPTPPPPPPPDAKMVYVMAPLLSRVGKKITITGMVYCGTRKVGGEKAWITINGELLTTMNTSNGKLTATWTPVVPGLYTICATVPGSSACNAAGSSCTTIQIVAQLTAPEIAAAEQEFEAAKERIGQIMERI